MCRSESLNFQIAASWSDSRRSQPDLDIGDGHAAFADCSGTTFHRAGAHVARSKNSWQTCLKRAGLMFARLPGRRPGHARPGFDESFVVALDFRRQPLRAWSSRRSWKTQPAFEPCRRSPSAYFPARFLRAFSRQTFCGSPSGKGSQCSHALAPDARDSPTFCW